MGYPRKYQKFDGYMQYAGMLVYADKVNNVPLTVTDGATDYTITTNVTAETTYDVSGLTPPI